MGCDGVQWKTRAHLGNGNHQERAPQTFYDLPMRKFMKDDCIRILHRQGTSDSCISSAARDAGLRPPAQAARSILVTYLDAGQPHSVIEKIRAAARKRFQHSFFCRLLLSGTTAKLVGSRRGLAVHRSLRNSCSLQRLKTSFGERGELVLADFSPSDRTRT